MTRIIFLLVLFFPAFLPAQKFELPWLIKPQLTGFDTFSAGWGHDQFIVAQKNSKYGLLTYKGRLILDFQYDRISADWAGVIFARQDRQEFWFDPKGNYFGENTSSVIRLEDKRYAVEKDGKWGVVNEKMKTVLPFEYRADDSDGKLTLIKGEERVNLGPFRTPDGSLAGPLVLKPINLDDDWPGVILHRDPKTRKRGIMGKDGTPVSPAVYNIYFGHPAGYAVASLDGKKWGIITSENKVIVDFTWDKIGKINDQLSAPVEVDDQSGVIDVTNGQLLIEPGQYDDILIVNKVLDYYVVEKNGLQGICDARGKLILPVVFDKALKSGPYLYVIRELQREYPQRGLYSLDGKELFKPDSVKLWVFDNGTLFTERPDGSAAHVDISGRVLQRFEPGTTTLFERNWIVEEDDAVRFYHAASTPEKPIVMDDVSDSEEGLHRIQKGDLYGYMLNSGKILVPPVLESAGMPDDKYLYVKYKGKWGVLKNTYY